MATLDPWYLSTLRCPADGSKLHLDNSDLISENGRKYPIVDGVPVMLLEEQEQTMGIARATIERAKGNREVVDQRAPEYYLETLGVSDAEKLRLIELASMECRFIDPVVSVIIAATSGYAYKSLIGNASLKEYPIPSIGLSAAGNGQDLLDIGCNWGRWCVAAARLGYRVVGLDPSLGAIMAARRVAAQMALDIKYVVGDARWLPFPQESFDVVYSYSVLQHFSKKAALRTLSEAGRLLRQGGIAKIQMANRSGIRSLQHQVRRRFREPREFEVLYWSVNELRKEFENHIGPTKISSDCYFGLGWQWADFKHMPIKLKPILLASEGLRRLSAVVPPIVRVSDSVFCTSIKASA